MTKQKETADRYGSLQTLNKVSQNKIHGMGIGRIASIFTFISEDSGIINLADKLEVSGEIQAVGVVDRSGKALGIITRKNLMGMLSRPFGRDVLRKKTVSSLITAVETFNINDNIFTVSEKIEKKVNSNTAHYFLLANDKREFSGIFSGKDLLVFLAGITRQDIALSRKIQSRIVKEEDELCGESFSLAAGSIMANGIGGDFYSFKKISDSHYLIVLCDVSGKGMAASLLSSQLSGFINTYPIDTNLTDLVTNLNTQLTRNFAGEKFITGVFMIFDEETGQLQLADMGHSYYMRFNRGKQLRISNSKVNIPLGISSEIDIKVYSIMLKRNDSFLLFTDGMIEQKNQEGGLYSLDNIRGVFANHQKLTAEELRAGLLSDFNTFKGLSARQDDISLIVIKYSPKLNAEISGLKDRKTGIEEKIKWALATGKPIQIRTNHYLAEDRDFIDSVLDRFLNEAGLKFLMNKLSYCVHELATNAKKANTKRVYFRLKELDINNPVHYAEGMKNFKIETIENIDFYLDKQKRLGYFIVITFQLTKQALKISVINNSGMTEAEKNKISHKLRIAGKTNTIGDIFEQIEDYSEGAGLGIVMMSQMFRTMGFGPDVLAIDSDQGVTTSRLQINLRE